MVERPRQAQYRPVRRRASAGAGRDRLQPRARARQGADRGAVQSRPQWQRDHGVAGAACGDHGRDRRRSVRSDGDRAGAGARRRRAAQERRRTADLRHDLSVFHPQLSAAVLDGGRRRRSRRGRSPRGAAAALHGGQSGQRSGRRVLRRRALEFDRGRSWRRPHPAFRLGHPGARRGEGARGPAKLVGKKSASRSPRWSERPFAPPNSSSSRKIAPRRRASWRNRSVSASMPMLSCERWTAASRSRPTAPCAKAAAICWWGGKVRRARIRCRPPGSTRRWCAGGRPRSARRRSKIAKAVFRPDLYDAALGLHGEADGAALDRRRGVRRAEPSMRPMSADISASFRRSAGPAEAPKSKY